MFKCLLIFIKKLFNLVKLTNIFDSLLLEATPEQIYNSYYKDIDRKIFDKIVLSDPKTRRAEDNTIVKIGKFAKLLLSLYKKNKLKIEDLPRYTEYLDLIYKHNIPVNIESIQSIGDLYNLIKDKYATQTTNLGDIRGALSDNEYDLLYDGQKWSIFSPKTERAACTLGVNTQWCTTWGKFSLNPSYKDRENQFQRYKARGPLYIMISKEDVNEKYQFHFESKQFMNKNDQQINTGNLLDDNPELKHFFFPSFVNPNVDDKTKDLELERLPVLSDTSSSVILKTVLNVSEENSPLIFNLINNDEDKVLSLINDDGLVRNDSLEMSKGRITFNVRNENNLPSYVEGAKDTLKYYQYDLNDPSDHLYNDIENVGSDYIDDVLKSYLLSYFQENSSKLSEFGFNNFDNFSNEFQENFIKDEKIREEFNEKYVRKNVGHYESAVESRVNDIEKYIDFSNSYSNTTISLPISQFSIYLKRKNINQIKDNLFEILDDYVYENDVQTEYEGIYDYQTETPEYTEISYEIESYFDNIFDDYESHEECSNARKELSNIIQKLFNGTNHFENDKLVFDIESTKVDCENHSVPVTYTNKETGETHKGPVKIENLASYVTNYKLFESLIKFKKFI